jgi:hypothetical protein
LQDIHHNVDGDAIFFPAAAGVDVGVLVENQNYQVASRGCRRNRRRFARLIDDDD